MLQELRQKPKHVREKYAFWGAIGTTAVIALIWGLSLSAKFNNLDTKNIEAVQTDNQESSGAFSRSFSDAKNSMASAWEAFTTNNDNPLLNEEVNVEANLEVGSPKENNSPNQGEETNSPLPSSVNNIRTIMIATTSFIMASSTE